MATTFGYSCRNNCSNGSGTRWLIALIGAGVTVGRQASICSIYQRSTTARKNVTAAPGAGELDRIYKVSAPESEPKLFALPAWLALFREGGQALFGIGGLEQPEDAAPLQCQGTLQGHLEALLGRQLDLADGDGRSTRQGRREGDGLRQQAVGRQQPIDEAEGGGRLRVQRLAGQEQFHRLLPADQPGQALGAAVAGQEAERHLGDTEPILAFGGKAKVRGERDLQPAAQAVAADGGDEDIWRGLHLQQHFVHVQDRHRPRLPADGAETSDVRAGAE